MPDSEIKSGQSIPKNNTPGSVDGMNTMKLKAFKAQYGTILVLAAA